MDNPKGLKFGQWLLKTGLASIFLGILFWYASTKNVTVAETINALASIPLAFVILIEVFDKVADKNDYYNKLVATFGAKKSRGTAILTSLIFAALGMMVIIWALVGSITVNAGVVGAANLFVAGLISLYIFAPETGDDELLLWAWLGATIATKGAYLILFPRMFGI